LQAIPKYKVLHIYLLVDGKIQVRLNIAGYDHFWVESVMQSVIIKTKRKEMLFTHL
jgi:hypothetical protein